MTERMYLFLVGSVILLALYLENNYLIYGLSVLLLLEGVSGFSLTRVIQRARRTELASGMVRFNTKTRFNIDGFNAWRIFASVVLLASYVLLHEYGYDVLWFFPWFMGFSILGAGASGICPVLLALRWAGFQ